MAPCIKYGVGDMKTHPHPIYLIHGNKTKGMSPLTRVNILKIFFPYLPRSNVRKREREQYENLI